VCRHTTTGSTFTSGSGSPIFVSLLGGALISRSVTASCARNSCSAPHPFSVQLVNLFLSMTSARSRNKVRQRPLCVSSLFRSCISLPRFTSKFCLSLDNSPSNTSGNTAHLNRWSEVVPPKTALTFAALWDPEEGMVTFSGAALLESESLSERSLYPNVFDDDHSQYISVDRDTDGGTTTTENTATLATFQDVFKAFLRHAPWDSREHLITKAGQGIPRGLQTRASSMFDGLDVYSHDIHLKSKRSLQLSCIDLLDMESSFRTPSAFGRLRLRSDLMLDSYRSESDSESSSGSRPSHLVSPSLSLINCVYRLSSKGHCSSLSGFLFLPFFIFLVPEIALFDDDNLHVQLCRCLRKRGPKHAHV
jgi:hypothetical protein